LTSDWRLLDLGDLPPTTTQVVYHAVATAVDENASPNTIIFCSPSDPLVCLGYHQELETEVDVDYCRQKHLPIVRRILGGGAVYLDNNQLFYQIMASRSDPAVPRSIQGLFEKFLAAPTKTYNDMGIPARYRPVNDLEVEGRKISGNGATEVGACYVLTGNIIFDFNFDEMARILRVPSEKFRDKVAKTLRERLTTIKKELAEPPSRDLVKRLLRGNYEATLGVKLVEGTLTSKERKLVESLESKYRSQEWLYLVESEHKGLIQKRNLKISGRSYLGEAIQKTPGGLLRALVETLDDKIEDIMITGDFSFVPQGQVKTLEAELIQKEVAQEALSRTIHDFYRRYDVESPGMTPEDIASVIVQASAKRS